MKNGTVELKSADFPVRIKNETSKPGVFQYTLGSERWYMFEHKDGSKTCYPSVTWILDCYPKGIGFKKWLGSLASFEESQGIMRTAGDRGSRVHAAIEQLLKGEKVLYGSPVSEGKGLITGDDWRLVDCFVRFFQTFTPTVLSVEGVVIGDGHAGTADLIAFIDEGLISSFNASKKNVVGERTGKLVKCLIDWKTTQSIYETSKIQVHEYAKDASQVEDPIDYVIIVRLSPKRKCGFELWISKVSEEGALYCGLFDAVKSIWLHENKNSRPVTVELPEVISLENGLEVGGVQ